MKIKTNCIMPTKVHFKNIKNLLLNEINSTNIKIDVAVAWITEPDIIKTLENLLSEKISVRIIAFDDKINNTDALKKLYYKGAEIKLSKGLMHNKFCIIDSKTVISGSFNWTSNASRNDENITINKDEIDLVKDYSQEFLNLWGKCPNIENKLKVNKYHLNDIESEFNNTVWSLEQHNFPFFYLVEVERKGRQFQHNKYGYLEKGYYLINSLKELKNDFKYIFYIENGFDLRELKKKTDIEFPFSLNHFTEIYPFSNNRKVIEINENIFALKKFEHSSNHWGQKFSLDLNGQIINKSLVIGILKDNRLLVHEDGKYLIFFENGQKLDFQINHRDGDSNFTNNDFMIGCEVQIIENQFFSARVLINQKDGIKRDALYNYDGKILTRPIFNHMWSSDFIENENKYIFKEYAVAYVHNQYIKYLPLFGGQHVMHIYREVILDLNKGKLFRFGMPKLAGNIPHREKLGIDENTRLLFAGDEKYGLFNQAIYILKTDLKIKDYNTGSDEFLKKTSDITHDNEKVSIAIEIISKYLSFYKIENENLIEEKKEAERIANLNKKSDSCFIATRVYGNLEHPHTIEFREFRDRVLVKNLIGRNFIKFYYFLSPKYVEFLNDKPRLLKLTKNILEIIRKRIL